MIGRAGNNLFCVPENQSWCLRDIGHREFNAEVTGISDDCPALIYIL